MVDLHIHVENTTKTNFTIKPDIAAYGCGTTDGSRTVYVGFRDSLGNTGSSYNTGSFVLDTTAPTLDPVTLASDNADSSLAKAGDELTLSFTASEALLAEPVVTILGHIIDPADINNVGLSYTAVYTVAGDDAEGPVSFTIAFTGAAGNPGIPVTAVTTGAGVTVDMTAPHILSLTRDTDLIFTGDLTESVSVTYDEPMDPASAPVITAITATGFTAGAGVWSAGNTVYTVLLTHDDTPEEIAADTIHAVGATDITGNSETTGDDSAAFQIDTVPPEILSTTGAFAGTAATVTFSEPVYGNSNATGALAASDFTYTDVSADGAASISSVIHTAGNTTLTLTLNSNLFSSDMHDTLAPAITSIYDAAGNAAGTTARTLTVTGTDGSFILHDGWNAFSTPKKLSAISFSNGGAGLTFYKLNGDTFSTVTADITTVTPLEGFLIKNTTGGNVNIDLMYDNSLEPGQKLSGKTLPAGWNLMGVSNATNAATNDGTTTTNIGTGKNLIDSLGTQVSECIDFTGTVGALATPVDFATGTNKGGVAFTTAPTWAIRNRSWFTGDQGDFADGKAYGVFIKAGGAALSGHQN